MRWDVIGLVIGWTLRIFALPLAVVGAYQYIPTVGNCSANLCNSLVIASVLANGCFPKPRVMKLVVG